MTGLVMPHSVAICSMDTFGPERRTRVSAESSSCWWRSARAAVRRPDERRRVGSGSVASPSGAAGAGGGAAPAEPDRCGRCPERPRDDDRGTFGLDTVTEGTGAPDRPSSLRPASFNAATTFAFLRQYDNLVPIWGIQKLNELDEFIAFEKNPPILDEAM